MTTFLAILPHFHTRKLQSRVRPTEQNDRAPGPPPINGSDLLGPGREGVGEGMSRFPGFLSRRQIGFCARGRRCAGGRSSSIGRSQAWGHERAWPFGPAPALHRFADGRGGRTILPAGVGFWAPAWPQTLSERLRGSGASPRAILTRAIPVTRRSRARGHWTRVPIAGPRWIVLDNYLIYIVFSRLRR